MLPQKVGNTKFTGRRQTGPGVTRACSCQTKLSRCKLAHPSKRSLSPLLPKAGASHVAIKKEGILLQGRWAVCLAPYHPAAPHHLRQTCKEKAEALAEASELRLSREALNKALALLSFARLPIAHQCAGLHHDRHPPFHRPALLQATQI